MIRVFSILFFISFGHLNGTAQTLSDYTWLEGEWTHVSGDQTTVESWSLRNDTTLVGSSLTTNASGATVFEEALKIQQHGTTVKYIAVLPTKIAEFVLKKHTKDLLVFEDPKNDFPSIISYKRVKSGLEIKLEGSGKKEVMDFEPKKQ
ncbi:MAG: hypothetical protein H6602_11305 [Flavobacteriales bacterium]|nr:hypothetical protein [Flavobacteriales bacterium]MCB9192242.1 hypothetical protein [Flavobacteriales bacterium]